MKTNKKPTLPIQIPLPERVLQPNGTMFVTLRTLEELEQFWLEHKSQFEFACEGVGIFGEKHYLSECEWVFGQTRSAVVRTVMRWDSLSVCGEYYDWATSEPADHAFWFRDRDGYRTEQIERGLWSDEDEAEYKADCLRRTPQNYRGYWLLKNLPGGCPHWDYLTDSDEIIDPNLSTEEAERTLQEQIFDEWKDSGCEEIRYHDRASIDKSIAYWREVKERGEDYYGLDNDFTEPKAP